MNAILEKRGILKAAKQFDWIERSYQGAMGWLYPVYHWNAGLGIASHESILGHRWKAASKEEANKLPEHLKGTKYLWIPAKPKSHDADWYILPPAIQAIAQAEGLAYMVNGEPALLAMMAAGFENAITTTLSEISVPPNIVLILQSLGVKKLLYVSDRDRAGIQSAAKWGASLLESGIDFVPLELPASLGAKADINDLWISSQFQAEDFAQSLKALPRLILPKLESPAKSHYGEYIVSTDIASAIGSYYGLLGTKINPNNGFYYRSVHCPFHEDKHASAGVHATKGLLTCHVCGSFGYQEHAKAIGINLSKFEPEKPLSKKDRPIKDSERLQFLAELNQVYNALTNSLRASKRRLSLTPEHPAIVQRKALLHLRQRLEQGFRVYKSEYKLIHEARVLLTDQN